MPKAAESAMDAAMARKRAEIEKRVAAARAQQPAVAATQNLGTRGSKAKCTPTSPQKVCVSQFRCDVSARTFDLAWSPGNNGQELLTASEDGVALWSTESGSPPHSLTLAHSRLKFALPSSNAKSDESKPAAPSSARAPSWLTAGERAHSHGDTPPNCMRVAWHPDSRQFLTGSDDGHVAVWDRRDGRPLGGFDAAECTEEQDSEVYGLAVLSMDSLLAVGCYDTVQQWDLPTCRQTALTRLAPCRAGVTFGGDSRNPTGMAYVFSLASRGRVLAVTLSDGTCRLLDSQNCKEHIFLVCTQALKP